MRPSYVFDDNYLGVTLPRSVERMFDSFGRLNEGQPGLPGGSSENKPMWSNTPTASVFFVRCERFTALPDEGTSW